MRINIQRTIVLTTIGAFLTGGLALAAVSKRDTAPYQPEVYKALRDLETQTDSQDTRLTSIEASPALVPYGTAGVKAQRVARAEYDVLLQGGTIGPHGLGVSLPAGAIVTRSYLQIGTQFVDAGAGSVALQCEDANNILTATDITALTATTLRDGQSTGSLATMVQGIAANCELTAVVAGSAQTAGKLVVFVEYVVGL